MNNMITKHTKIVATVALLILLGALIALGVLWYLISVSKEAFAVQQKEIAKAHVHERELASLARLVEESEEERTLLASYMLKEEDVIDFLSLLENMAKEQGVVIEIRSLNVGEIDDSFEELQVNLTAEGSYEAVHHTLRLLETLAYQSYVGSASISRKGNSNAMWLGTFTLHVVKYKEQAS